MYLILCALMANFPDIDTIIVRLLRLEHFNHHRTWSHSFLGSLFFVPLLAFLVKMVLGSTVGTLHALFIAFACFYSHLLTDWITSYGIGLFWTPGQTTEFYSLGVITIFDSVTLIIWYTCFIMSWYGVMSPTRILMLFSIALTAWLSYKRVLLFVALKYSWTLSKGPIHNSWFQPSSFNPMLYGFFQAAPEEQGGIKLRADIRPYRIEPERSKKFAWDHAYSWKSLYSNELGFTRVAPREALIASATHGSVYRKWMFKQTIWSLGLVAMHFFWFVYAIINY